MSEKRALELLLAAKEELQTTQAIKATRDRAIALTNLETAILWLVKDPVYTDVDNADTVKPIQG